jgi:hypothetical protein
MGWTENGYRAPGESHAEFFGREIFGEGREILASAHIGAIGGTFYAAVRERETQEVWALVVLTGGTSGASFRWKEMSEEMGPCEDCCPQKILELLTPTSNKYALSWRERCRRRLARVASVTVGTAVEFEVDFLTPEGPCRNFVAIDPGHGIFRSQTGVTYRITSWRSESFVVLGDRSQVVVIGDGEEAV